MAPFTAAKSHSPLSTKLLESVIAILSSNKFSPNWRNSYDWFSVMKK